MNSVLSENRSHFWPGETDVAQMQALSAGSVEIQEETPLPMFTSAEICFALLEWLHAQGLIIPYTAALIRGIEPAHGSLCEAGR